MKRNDLPAYGLDADLKKKVRLLGKYATILLTSGDLSDGGQV